MEENIEQLESDAFDSPSGQYDTVAKNVVRDTLLSTHRRMTERKPHVI